MVKVGLVWRPEVVPANCPNIESRCLAMRLTGAGSTTLVGQLSIETKCPDPPANLLPPPAQPSPTLPRGRTSARSARRVPHPIFHPLPSASEGREPLLSPASRPASRPVPLSGPNFVENLSRRGRWGSSPSIKKRIPTPPGAAGDPNFVPAGDLIPTAHNPLPIPDLPQT
jgi:hypothetical protein